MRVTKKRVIQRVIPDPTFQTCFSAPLLRGGRFWQGVFCRLKSASCELMTAIDA